MRAPWFKYFNRTRVIIEYLAQQPALILLMRQGDKGSVNNAPDLAKKRELAAHPREDLVKKIKNMVLKAKKEHEWR